MGKKSQSPQIGSWFQYKELEDPEIREFIEKSQSPQIGSWFQSNLN